MGEDIMVPDTFPVIDDGNVIIEINSKFYLSDKLGLKIITSNIITIIINILFSQSRRIGATLHAKIGI